LNLVKSKGEIMAIKELGIDVTSVSATPEHELGVEVTEVVGGQGTITRTYNTNGIGTTGVDTVSNYAANKRYRYVRADAAILAGDACMKKFGETDDPYAVVKTAATTDLVDGVAEVAVPDQYYFFLTIHGFVKNVNVEDASARGDILGAGATAGRLTTPTFTTTAATLAQLQAGVKAAMKGIQAVTDGSAGNLADIFIHGN
jgi:hypothetical protein